MKAAVIGLGLIGGSFALELKRLGWHVSGADASADHAMQALERGLVHAQGKWEDIVDGAELIVLAMPVDAIASLAPAVLDRMREGQVLIDLGSTKGRILEAVQGNARRAQFVACHPMAGTEFSGPAAAHEGLFANRFVVICAREASSPAAVALVEGLFGQMGMQTVYYSAEAHDMHAAFVSHISHVSSFALALTVLDKEQNEKDIFQLAAGGFTSTVRLAKSAPHTWVPIFRQNKAHLLSVLDAHMEKLGAFKTALTADDPEALHQLIAEANQIKRIIS